MFELIYCSTAIRNLDEQSVYEILHEARKFNVKNGITGCLVYFDSEFVQILEGEKETVKKLFSKISGDPRHGSIQQVYEGEKNKRWFEGWSMAFERSMADQIISDYMSINELKMHKVTASESNRIGFSKTLFFDISQRLVKSKSL